MRKDRKQARKKRHQRMKAKFRGTAQRPRLSVFRSHRHVYAALFDDEKGRTLLSVSDRDLQKKGARQGVELARELGELIAKRAKEQSIEKAVFDRAGYLYHGKIKALAEGARQGGLKF